jgi:uncharacterized protein YyaL (SSP411 family)
MDNATPSGNSLAAELLQRSGHLFGDEALDRIASQAIDREARAAHAYPLAFGRLLSLASRRLMTPIEVAIVGTRGEEATHALAHAALQPWLPQRVVLGAQDGEALPFPIPLLEGRGAVDGKATAYVCTGYACQAPVSDPAGVARGLATALEARASRAS